MAVGGGPRNIRSDMPLPPTPALPAALGKQSVDVPPYKPTPLKVLQTMKKIRVSSKIAPTTTTPASSTSKKPERENAAVSSARDQGTKKQPTKIKKVGLQRQLARRWWSLIYLPLRFVLVVLFV